MQFANGRFTGMSPAGFFYVFRFDSLLGHVSGEIYSPGQVSTGFDPNGNPTANPMAQFSTVIDHLHPSTLRDSTITLSPLGTTLILTSRNHMLTFSKNSDGSVLDVEFRRDGPGVVLKDSTLLSIRSETVFRALELEIDQTAGTEPLGSFSLSGRVVTLEECLARAGLQVNITLSAKKPPKLDSWNDTELHNAMNNFFDEFDPESADRAWKAYMLIASRYAEDSSVLGYMFDSKGRRGSAVFYSAVKNGLSGSEFQKRFVRTAVHELGHSLNLLHTFDPRSDSFLGRGALSFMNYPSEFSGGETDYWNRFQFELDTGEMLTLRHAPIEQLIQGGDPFRGLQRKDNATKREVPVRKDLNLQLRVRPKRQEIPIFEFGEPVELEAKLMLCSKTPVHLTEALEPSYCETVYTIRKPDGNEVVFQPLTRICAESQPIRLYPKGRTSIYAPAFLAFGADGFPFMVPGLYHVHATLNTRSGIVRSQPIRLWVRYPDRKTEDLVVPTFDDDFGRFLALRGGPHLTKAHRIFDDFISNNGEWHPLAQTYTAYQTLQKAHGFKSLRKRTVSQKKPYHDEKAFQALLGLSKGYQSKGSRPRIPNHLFSHLAATIWRGLDSAGEKEQASLVKKYTRKQLREQGIKDFALRDYSHEAFFTH